MPTKQEMLDRITEVIADKTLSFWCKIQRNEDEGPINIWYYNPYSGNNWQKRTVWQHELMGISEWISLAELHDIYKVIWHPVMINRVEWYFKKNKRPDLCISIEEDDLIKTVEQRPDKIISQLYDNLLILWCIKV